MKRMEGKVSRIEKAVEERYGSKSMERFWKKLEYPEIMDLILLSIEGIVVKAQEREGRIPKGSRQAFLKRVEAYCQGKEVEVWEHSVADALLGKTKGLIRFTYKKSRPSKPLNFRLVARVLGLDEEVS